MLTWEMSLFGSWWLSAAAVIMGVIDPLMLSGCHGRACSNQITLVWGCQSGETNSLHNNSHPSGFGWYH